MLRSDRVLFAYLTNTDAYFIDVLPHKKADDGVAWADKGILETLDNEWPDLLRRFELKGVKPPPARTQFNSSQIHFIRKVGGTPTLVLNGRVYMEPGMGLATDRSSTRAVMMSIDIKRELGRMERLFRESSEHAKANLFVAADASIGFFLPAQNKAISFLPAQTSDCQVTWFFKRLLQEIPIFRGTEGLEIWLRPGVQLG